jgi:chemosensory pili system protein ChpA (sensor histidine kinase/response regulator)
LVAKDGLEALEIIQSSAKSPDVILVDIEMPRMDGYELMSTLKAHQVYQNIPLVVLTSRAGDKHRRKALEVGALEYIVKPYQDEMLFSIIRQLVQESRRALSS